MNDPIHVSASTTLHAGTLTPVPHVEHGDGTQCIRLAPFSERGGLYIEGSLDELAKFVQDLANVVREINARELAASATA